MFMRAIQVLFFLVLFTQAIAQTPQQNVNALRDKIDRYITIGKPDSAFICLSAFLERDKPDTMELFFGHLYMGFAYFQTKRPEMGMTELRTSVSLVKNSTAYQPYLYRAYENLANEFFTAQVYDSAYVYANLTLGLVEKLPIDDRIRLSKARCNNILGFCSFLKEKYILAIGQFQKSVDNYNASGNPCDNALVYCKMAKVYNRLNDKAKTNSYLRQALDIADTCQAEDYLLVCRYSQFEILKENGQYKEALASLEEINRQVEVMDNKRQMDKINELEVQYKTKLKNQEYLALQQINLKNEEVLSKQRLTLYITLGALLLLAFLIFLMIRSYIRRNHVLREIERTKLEIEAKNKELERMNLLNQKVFSVVSHDLKGPMLSLQLMLNSQREYTSGMMQAHSQDVSNQLASATQILDNLLNWARSEMNVQVNESENSVPYNVANEITAQFSTILEKKNIRISNHIPEWLYVQMPSDVLRIAFRNLLSNAIKYSFEGAEIEINFNPAEKTISIKDYGTGINDAKLQDLFTRDIETSLGTWQEAGFGLGLYITHELLHRFGGQISARNHTKGMEFTIHFSRTKNY